MLPHHPGSNGAVAGTISSYMSVCHNIHIPKDVDIVFVEYRYVGAGQVPGRCREIDPCISILSWTLRA